MDGCKSKKVCLLVQNPPYTSAAQPHSYQKAEAVVGSNRNRNCNIQLFYFTLFTGKCQEIPKTFQILFETPEYTEKRNVQAENRKGKKRGQFIKSMLFSFIYLKYIILCIIRNWERQCNLSTILPIEADEICAKCSVCRLFSNRIDNPSENVVK